MRQKELRIALVCYGGVSLAVYMHGVTKELWKLLRASRDNLDGMPDDGAARTTEGVYLRLLRHVEAAHGVRLRVLADIVAGASAGGINGVFLAQAIHSGQSLEPLTTLWLERADVDVLLDPDARPWSRIAKFWATPIVWWLLRRPGNAISDSVAPETREEVRTKLSRLIRSRWFEPPFGGMGFANLICEALHAMAGTDTGTPLLPPDHPLDLFVTATDFKGHLETLRLHSPQFVQESEHRLSIGFRALTPPAGGGNLAHPLELVFAARATASFPGAFPPLMLREIDALAQEHGDSWTSRSSFVDRIMPEHRRSGDVEQVALIDGSVLVNAPFAEAMAVLRDRPAQREVDRRFVYIDPHPDRVGGMDRADPRPPGFFSVIFGSLSSIPREQPVRDNLEQLARESHETARLRGIVQALRPEVEFAVEKLFGHTLFLDKPTARRLSNWRGRAQKAAASQAGFAFHGYAQLKLTGIVEELSQLVFAAAPGLGLASPEPIARHLGAHLVAHGLGDVAAPRGGASEQAVAFFRSHDISFRVRRLRLLARRLTQDWDEENARGGESISEEARDRARESVFQALSMYFGRQSPELLGADFSALAARVFEDPAAVLDGIAARRKLIEVDALVDTLMAAALADMPTPLRRRILLAYLGFPFYDTVTLPLLRGEGLTEFEPIKVDRISPDDAPSIREGGAQATLRGVEFYNFGAFFSRAYRENDYLWGRLHGAERMIDLVASALPDNAALSAAELQSFKRAAFEAVLAEESGRLNRIAAELRRVEAEITARMGNRAE